MAPINGNNANLYTYEKSTVMNTLRRDRTLLHNLPSLHSKYVSSILFHCDTYNNMISPSAAPGSLLSYHIDHIEALASGSATSRSNLQAIDSRANMVKGTKAVTDCYGSLTVGISEAQVLAVVKHVENKHKDSSALLKTKKRLVKDKLTRIFLKSPPKGVKWNGDFQSMYKRYLTQLREKTVTWREGKENGALLYEYIDAFVGHGAKPPRRAITAEKKNNNTITNERDPWSKEETASFEKAKKKHAKKRSVWAAILEDTSNGSYGSVYGGRRTNVDLKDRNRNIMNGAAGAYPLESRKRGRSGMEKVAVNAQKKQRVDRDQQRYEWGVEETELFLKAVEKQGKGKWAAMLADETPGSYGAVFGGKRTNVHLKDKARALKL
ncbi:hypothetical protein TrST_g8311 [Triparma strigata]|uniref:Myb-like domain-containing protein n=1 Tax=Triparma strigata TaxID=1606541 RepID=A0A9W7BY72_9STRA|nr:hypothetical protein TrST_g8311 [Triparma strigata]